jgi:hypothetical protein
MTKGTVVLKTGQKFETVFEDNREFSVKSLTDETIQAFPTRNGTKAIFVQGSNIAYIEVDQ